MITTQVNFGAFCDAWRNHGREDSFTYAGKRALFDWLEDYSDALGEPVELDIVDLDCEFAEYSDLEEVQGDYSGIESQEDLEDRTTVLRFDGGLIIASF